MSDSSDCLFCKMAAGEIAPSVVLEDEAVLAFKDINPQAPLHVLLIPKQHIGSTSDLQPEQDALVGRLVRTAALIAERNGLRDGGYRLVANCGPDAGQSVQHLHFHLIGGRKMAWPPG